MIGSNNQRDTSPLTDLPQPEVEQLTAEEAQSTHGGAVANIGATKVTQDDESPKETVTFEYGGLAIQYGQQKV